MAARTVIADGSLGNIDLKQIDRSRVAIFDHKGDELDLAPDEWYPNKWMIMAEPCYYEMRDGNHGKAPYCLVCDKQLNTDHLASDRHRRNLMDNRKLPPQYKAAIDSGRIPLPNDGLYPRNEYGCIDPRKGPPPELGQQKAVARSEAVPTPAPSAGGGSAGSDFRKTVRPVDCNCRPIPRSHFDCPKYGFDAKYCEELFKNPQFYELHNYGSWAELRCMLCPNITKINSSHTPDGNTHRKGVQGAAYGPPRTLRAGVPADPAGVLPPPLEGLQEGVNVPVGFRHAGTVRIAPAGAGGEPSSSPAVSPGAAIATGAPPQGRTPPQQPVGMAPPGLSRSSAIGASAGADLAERERRVTEREKRVADKLVELEAREKAVQARERAVESREKEQGLHQGRVAAPESSSVAAAGSWHGTSWQKPEGWQAATSIDASQPADQERIAVHFYSGDDCEEDEDFWATEETWQKPVVAEEMKSPSFFRTEERTANTRKFGAAVPWKTSNLWFIRPDGDTEMKDFAWLEENGFSELEVAPGAFTGNWWHTWPADKREKLLDEVLDRGWQDKGALAHSSEAGKDVGTWKDIGADTSWWERTSGVEVAPVESQSVAALPTTWGDRSDIAARRSWEQKDKWQEPSEWKDAGTDAKPARSCDVDAASSWNKSDKWREPSELKDSKAEATKETPEDPWSKGDPWQPRATAERSRGSGESPQTLAERNLRATAERSRESRESSGEWKAATWNEAKQEATEDPGPRAAPAKQDATEVPWQRASPAERSWESRDAGEWKAAADNSWKDGGGEAAAVAAVAAPERNWESRDVGEWKAAADNSWKDGGGEAAAVAAVAAPERNWESRDAGEWKAAAGSEAKQEATEDPWPRAAPAKQDATEVPWQRASPAERSWESRDAGEWKAAADNSWKDGGGEALWQERRW